MKRIYLIIIFFISLFSCNENAPNFASDFVEKSWCHSWEDDAQDDLEVYKSGSLNDFPPARYRQTFHFFKDETCEFSVLAENDAHYTKSGSWDYNKSNQKVKIFDQDGELKHSFEIVSIDENTLIIKPF